MLVVCYKDRSSFFLMNLSTIDNKDNLTDVKLIWDKPFILLVSEFPSILRHLAELSTTEGSS